MTRLFIGALAIGFMAVCMPDRTFAVPQAPQGQTWEEVVRDSSPDAAPTKKVESTPEVPVVPSCAGSAEVDPVLIKVCASAKGGNDSAKVLVNPMFDVGLADVAGLTDVVAKAEVA